MTGSGPAIGSSAQGPGPSPAPWTTDEIMTITAARRLRDGASVFVGIGLPSMAANLARRIHAPDLALIYESGALGAKPDFVPLSIGDGILADTADMVVSVPEVFNYWLQPMRIDVGFLAAAQIDRYANINTTVIGRGYASPTVRLPGAGGAPEIAASCHEVMIVARQTPRIFVEKLDFVTSVGHGSGPGSRKGLGLSGRGPQAVITDLGVLEPDPHTMELTLTAVHPGVCAEQVAAQTGWELKISATLSQTEEPTKQELRMLRHLQATKGGADAGQNHR
jgi:glutaconate CoA-transferase subunit B